MFFQVREMKTLSLVLSLSSFPAKYSWAQPPSLPSSFYYSHTLTHYLFHTPFLPPFLSHLSLLSSPGTSMCFSLIEMHFNVVQISFLQLQSKLATCACMCECVYACMCTRAIYMCACEKYSHSWKCYLPARFSPARLLMPPSLSHKLTFLVQH